MKIDQNRELFYRFQIFRKDDEQLQGVCLVFALHRQSIDGQSQLFAISIFEENFEYPVEFLISSASVYVLRQGTADNVTTYWTQHVIALSSITVCDVWNPLHRRTLLLLSSSTACCACKAL